MNTLQKATLINAISTFSSGLAILIFHKQLAAIFGSLSENPFLIVGGIITFFSLTMMVEFRKQRPLAILWIITQDSAWILATVIVLLIRPFNITDTGYLLIALFALPILFFIFFQSRGIARIDNKASCTLKTLTFKKVINAGKKQVWEVISDVANYHKVADNIDNVQIISGQGTGMVRTCSHGNDSWSETCTLWEPEKQYSFKVDTNAPDYPFPLKQLKGNWSINELNPQQTEVIMEFEFAYRRKIFNVLLHPISRHKFLKTGNDLLEKWKQMIEK